MAEILQGLQKTQRWTFGYMGANQDLADVSKHLGIPKGNTLSYMSSRVGTAVAHQQVSDSVRAYSRGRPRGGRF